MRKAVACIRVSDEDQRKGYSITTQREVIGDYAKDNSFEIVEWFEESASAWKVNNRPGFDRMVKFLKRSKSVKHVLCFKLDRVARNFYEYGLLTEVLEVSLVSATELLPENSVGSFMSGISIAAGRLESTKTSERVSACMKAKAGKGIWPSYAPMGYLNKDKKIIPDPELGPLVKEMFEIYATSKMSIRELVEWGKKRGLRTRKGNTITRTGIHKLLNNPIYYGEFKWKEVLYKGTHEPLISRALFDRIQEKQHGHTAPARSQKFAYRGLLTCAYCGLHLTAERKKGKYTYYHCHQSRGKCEQPWTREEEVAQALTDIVDCLHVEPEAVEKIICAVRDLTKKERRDRKERLLRLRCEEQDIREQREAAYEDKLNRAVRNDLWIATENRLMERLEIVRGEIQRLSESIVPVMDGTRRVLELLERAPHLYKTGSDEFRVQLLKCIASNFLVRGGNIVPEYRKPFGAVAKGLVTDNWYAREDSNLRPSQPQCDALIR